MPFPLGQADVTSLIWNNAIERGLNKFPSWYMILQLTLCKSVRGNRPIVTTEALVAPLIGANPCRNAPGAARAPGTGAAAPATRPPRSPATTHPTNSQQYCPFALQNMRCRGAFSSSCASRDVEPRQICSRRIKLRSAVWNRGGGNGRVRRPSAVHQSGGGAPGAAAGVAPPSSALPRGAACGLVLGANTIGEGFARRCDFFAVSPARSPDVVAGACTHAVGIFSSSSRDSSG